MRQVGLIEWVKGLKSKNRDFPEKRGLCFQTGTWKSCLSSKPAWVGRRVSKAFQGCFLCPWIHSEAEAWDFPGGSVVKNQPYIAGDVGSIPVWGLRSHMSQGN